MFNLRWLTFTNHKDIGILYFLFGLWAGIIGLSLSFIICLESEISSSYLRDAHLYNMVVIAHAFIIIFFLVEALLIEVTGKLFFLVGLFTGIGAWALFYPVWFQEILSEVLEFINCYHDYIALSFLFIVVSVVYQLIVLLFTWRAGRVSIDPQTLALLWWLLPILITLTTNCTPVIVDLIVEDITCSSSCSGAKWAELWSFFRRFSPSLAELSSCDFRGFQEFRIDSFLYFKLNLAGGGEVSPPQTCFERLREDLISPLSKVGAFRADDPSPVPNPEDVVHSPEELVPVPNPEDVVHSPEELVPVPSPEEATTVGDQEKTNVPLDTSRSSNDYAGPNLSHPYCMEEPLDPALRVESFLDSLPKPEAGVDPKRQYERGEPVGKKNSILSIGASCAMFADPYDFVGDIIVEDGAKAAEAANADQPATFNDPSRSSSDLVTMHVYNSEGDVPLSSIAPASSAPAYYVDPAITLNSTFVAGPVVPALSEIPPSSSSSSEGVSQSSPVKKIKTE